MSANLSNSRWFEARGLLLGLKYETCRLGPLEPKRDFKRVFELARLSHHQEAAWLLSVFPYGMSDKETATEVLLTFVEYYTEDGDMVGLSRALCYAGLVDGEDLHLVERAAELGHSFAVSVMMEKKPEVWLSKGLLLVDGPDCLMVAGSMTEHLELLKKSALLGNADAAYSVASAVEWPHPDRFSFGVIGLEFREYSCPGFLSDFDALMLDIKGFYAVIFSTTAMLKKLITSREGEWYICGFQIDTCYVDRWVPWLLDWYSRVCERTRRECIEWGLLARMMKLNRDVRGIVSKLVWESRNEFVESRVEKDLEERREKLARDSIVGPGSGWNSQI